MDSNNVLRLALILSSSQTHTFRKNLNKLVKLVLFDSYSKPLNIITIANSIKNEYSLEFSESEIVSAIKDDSGIIIRTDKDPIDYSYELTPEEYQKISLRQQVNIDQHLSSFIDAFPDYSLFTFESAKDIIYRFIYITLNSDTQTLLELMDIQIKEKKEYCITKEFNSDEAIFINEFLNWDNKPKNEFILNLISSCFDYCMLTIKKDNNSYANVFSGKNFYLDSNIIFRLAGFNKVERQSVMNAFISKCKDSNIKICYTNHTLAEIKNTIIYHVSNIKSMLNKSRPLSLRAVQVMSSKYANLDFYEKYVEWCKDNPSLIGDYEQFRRYLEEKIQKVLSSFKLMVFDDKNTFKNHTVFSELYDDFNQFKLERYKNTYEGAIKTDINNYLYIMEINGDAQATNFMQLKHYFITADHCLTEWATLKRPGTIPSFVLPSVWYSILLKYKGRSDDDYNAFCQFLNIRIVPDKDIHVEEKRKMLEYILTLNEESEIKEQIVFDIENRLLSIETDIDDPIAFAEESHLTILQENLLKQKESLEKEGSQNLENIKEQMAKESKTKINQLEKEKEEIAKSKFLEGQKNIINNEALQIQKRNKNIIKAFSIVVSIGLMVCLIAFLLLLFIKKTVSSQFTIWYNKNAGTIQIISFIVAALSFTLRLSLKNLKILETDLEKIENKLAEKYELNHND